MGQTITLTKESESIKYLCKQDKRLEKVISLVGDITYSLHDDAYSFIVREIIEQMLSIKAADKIYCRLIELCHNQITPEIINTLSVDQIKGVGMSMRKANYIKTLTELVLSGSINFDVLSQLSDEKILEELCSIKGIGSWTAKMYLIFVLNRQNVLPFEDVTFLQSYKWLYQTNDTKRSSVQKKCKKWVPFSSIGARYLYRAFDMGFTKTPFKL